jgi:hypothetical protein
MLSLPPSDPFNSLRPRQIHDNTMRLPPPEFTSRDRACFLASSPAQSFPSHTCILLTSTSLSVERNENLSARPNSGPEERVRPLPYPTYKLYTEVHPPSSWAIRRRALMSTSSPTRNICCRHHHHVHSLATRFDHRIAAGYEHN